MKFNTNFFKKLNKRQSSISFKLPGLHTGYTDKLMKRFGKDTSKNKFFGERDDTAISLQGKKLKKVGYINLDRTRDWGLKKVKHELWEDENKTVRVATNAERPTDKWICNDRICPKDNVQFIPKHTGYQVNNNLRGDLFACPKCKQKYVEGLGYESLDILDKEEQSKNYVYLQPTKQMFKDIKEDKVSKKDFIEKFQNKVGAYVWQDKQNNIIMGGGLKKVDFNKDKNINILSNVVGHEELHNVLKKEQSPIVSKQFDNVSVPLMMNEEDTEIVNPNTYSKISYKKRLEHNKKAIEMQQDNQSPNMTQYHHVTDKLRGHFIKQEGLKPHKITQGGPQQSELSNPDYVYVFKTKPHAKIFQQALEQNNKMPAEIITFDVPKKIENKMTKDTSYGMYQMSAHKFKGKIPARYIVGDEGKNYIYLQPTKEHMKYIQEKGIPKEEIMKAHNKEAAYTWRRDNNNIIVGGSLKKIDFNKNENINAMSHLIGHEELHNLLREEHGRKVSSRLDNITVPLITNKKDNYIINTHTNSNISIGQKRFMERNLDTVKTVKTAEKDLQSNQKIQTIGNTKRRELQKTALIQGVPKKVVSDMNRTALINLIRNKELQQIKQNNEIKKQELIQARKNALGTENETYLRQLERRKYKPYIEEQFEGEQQ